MNFDPNQPSLKSLQAISSERTNKLVVFAGAGLSCPAGIPTWQALRSQLTDVLSARADDLPIENRTKIRIASQYAAMEDNLWVAFGILKKELGEATFRATIRKSLAVADACVVPEAYLRIWDLNLAGVLTLNLDRLTAKSFSQRRSGRLVEEFPGYRASRFTHLIKSQNPFIANLHGTASDYDSWVFTHDDLSELLRTAGYRQFIEGCFVSHTVVFCGITAEDVAAGGFIARLAELRVDSGEHFWITNRNDAVSSNWSETAGIQKILYVADASHSGLTEILSSLATTKPSEQTPRPVIISEGLLVDSNEPDVFVDPDELEMWEPERLRAYLNRQASALLHDSSADAYAAYSSFCKTYDAAIHRAWYVQPGSNRDTLFGYRLIEEIGRGAFGRIFEAEDPAGAKVAVKILHESIRNDPEKLQGFRRGVASMKILDGRKVAGVVAYKMAAEIPAAAIMDFIPGENLSAAVAKYGIPEWIDILSVAKQFVGILRRSHLLPERVLHRDLRPHNIMIENPWDKCLDWTVKVLDFDLSWHRDAEEVSIEQPGASNAYLPPEMVYRRPGVTTRSALVDSFGIGMTLFYMVTRRDPKPMESSLPNWKQTLASEVECKRCQRWKSLPRRFARLIRNATRDNQSERVDVVQIESEIDRLLDAVQDERRVLDLDLWAEELLIRSTDLPFKYDENSGAYELNIGGLALSVQPSAVESEIDVYLDWRQQGGEHYGVVRKWIDKAVDQINSRMRHGGWRGSVSIGSYQITGKFSTVTSSLQRDFERLQTGLTRAIESAQFEG